MKLTRGRANRLILSAAGAAVAWSTGIGARAASAPVKFAAIPSDFDAVGYYALELGLFKKYGLEIDLSPIANAATMQSATVSSSLDIGASNIVSMSLAHDRGLPFTIVGAANIYEATAPTIGILTVAKTGPIRSAADLNGKTIGVIAVSDISDLGVRAWVDRNGGNSKTLKFLELPLPLLSDAVRAGRIDAASLDAVSAAVTKKPDSDLRVLGNVMDAISPRFMSTVFFATGDWVEKHSDESKAFASALRDAAVWANAHRPESAKILTKYTKFTLAQIEGATRSFYGTNVTPQSIQPCIDACAKYGMIKSAFPAQSIISSVAR
jgi:NitT/TauT family transport system substrate-binding protein